MILQRHLSLNQVIHLSDFGNLGSTQPHTDQSSQCKARAHRLPKRTLEVCQHTRKGGTVL